MSEPDAQNPAYGAHLEPFAGIPSFMRLPASRDLDSVDVAVVGIPFDSGTSYRSGTRLGPRKIREASTMLWGHNDVMGVSPLEVLTVVDYGDVSVIPVDIRATMQNITDEVASILAAGTSVLTLGGDHSITLPLLRAHHAAFGKLAVVQFDSHPDTWDHEFGEAQPYSHGTGFRRAIEEGLIDTDAFLQIGIRGPVTAADDVETARRLGSRVVTIGEAFEMGIPAIVRLIHEKVGDRPLYVSLDIDSLDPAYAPGTGTPEVGGFTSWHMLQLMRGLKGLNFTGFDIVEVSPPYDHSEITSILAANLAFEFLSLLALRA